MVALIVLALAMALQAALKLPEELAATAHCWQYSPVDRTFVTVGGWTT